MEPAVRARRPFSAAFLIGLGLWALTPHLSFAQPSPQTLLVRASKDVLAPINLRPNGPTPVRLVVENPTDDGLRDVTVKLVQILNDEPRVLASKELDKLPSKAKAVVAFAKGKEGKEGKDGKDAKEAKNGADKLELVGPPFKVQVWIEAKSPKDFATIKQDVDLVIREPHDYVTASAQFDKLKGRLSFKVKLDEDENLLGANPCKVELVLGPELVPSKKGTYKQQLSGAKQPVDLFADDVSFADPSSREGRVYLMVDSYQRAFTYPVSLTGSGNLDEVSFAKRIGARIVVPRFARPDAKFKVQLELDGPLDPSYRVELGLDRAGAKEQFQTVSFTGLRRQKISFSINPAGDLLWSTVVSDHHAEFDTTGVFGDIWFRVRVFNKNGGKEKEAELIYPEQAIGRMAPLEADGDSKRLYARVSQDESSPNDIEIVDLPKQWPAGKPLPLIVKLGKRAEAQAPVEKVLLIRGKIPADGKLGPDAVLGVGEFDVKAETWAFTLPAQEKNDALIVTIQVTTQTGISATKVIPLVITAPGQAGLAKIKGTVAHGALPQKGRPVALANKEGKIIATTKSIEEGAFVFEKVPPGEYTVYSSMSTPALVGQTPVSVPEGVELVDKVLVKLKAK
jgi:hypothetical protein